MSATNHTTNYNLPQFVGTDKPTWLTDVNGAMSAIDTQMKANADSATTAVSNATTAMNSVGTLANLNTTDKTSTVGAINEINTGLQTTSGVASSASGTATEAKTAVEAVATYLNINSFVTTNANALTWTNASNPSSIGGNITTASNSDGSLGKIYGRFTVTPSSSTTNCKFTLQTPFRPTTDLTINNTSVVLVRGDGILRGNFPFTISTTGLMTMEFDKYWYNKTIDVILVACVIFFKDFGDQPE